MFGLKELCIAQGSNCDDLKTKIQQLSIKAFAYILTMVHQFSLPPMLPNHSIVDQIHPQPAQGQNLGRTSSRVHIIWLFPWVVSYCQRIQQMACQASMCWWLELNIMGVRITGNVSYHLSDNPSSWLSLVFTASNLVWALHKMYSHCSIQISVLTSPPSASPLSFHMSLFIFVPPPPLPSPVQSFPTLWVLVLAWFLFLSEALPSLFFLLYITLVQVVGTRK